MMSFEYFSGYFSVKLKIWIKKFEDTSEHRNAKIMNY